MINVTIGNTTNRNRVIVDENNTLRQALEENGVDYSMGQLMLDGATLQPGMLDRTFADLGITTSCYLLSVVKADNAAKIKVAGRAVVVESDADLDSIKTLGKYRPNALKLFETEGSTKQEVFRVGVTSKGTGSINPIGVSFAPQANADGKAIVTMLLPEDVTDAKKWAEETIGTGILQLNKVEAQFAAAAAEIEAELAAIRDNIQVL